MATSPDNFFGLDFLSYNPYGQMAQSTLDRYMMIDQLLMGREAPPDGDTGRTPVPRPGGPTPPSGPNPGDGSCSGVPGFTCQPGQVPTCLPVPGGNSRWACMPAGHDPENPPGAPPPPGTPPPQTPPNRPNPNPGGDDDRTAVPGRHEFAFDIPQDLRALRQSLGNFLNSNFSQTFPSFGGNLNASSPYLGQAAQAGSQGIGAANQFLGAGAGMLGGLQGFNPFSNMGNLEPAMSQLLGGKANDMGMGVINAGMPSFWDMAYTGGQPNIQSALDAIKSQGMLDIEDQNAQTREQFGAMGLGAGSDVAEAVARGSSRGIADINARQSALSAQVGSDAASRRLGALGMIPGLSQQVASPYENASARQAATFPTMFNVARSGADEARMNAALQLQGAGVSGGLAQAASQPHSQYAALLAQLGTVDAGLQGENMNRQLANFQRSTTPMFLDSAISFASGFPPQKPQDPAGNTGSWLSMIGQLGASALPFLLSDRNAKEDIVPYRGSALTALRELEISTWRYKDGGPLHIGPMAQDVKKLFGVGDGVTINMVDVMGIVFATLKELAHGR